MLERDTGRPRGFGFLTFSDRQSMEDAIREMNGSDFGERVISVNKAQPKMGGDDLDRGYGGSYPSGGSDRSTGHWARDCPFAGGQISSRSRFGGGREDRYSDRVRYVDDRYDAGRFGDRDRYDNRDNKYGSRSRYANDRYPPPAAAAVANGYGYSGGATRYEGRSYSHRDRAGPYDPPPPLFLRLLKRSSTNMDNKL